MVRAKANSIASVRNADASLVPPAIASVSCEPMGYPTLASSAQFIVTNLLRPRGLTVRRITVDQRKDVISETTLFMKVEGEDRC